MPQKRSLTERLDALYEFDRAPVTHDRLDGPGNFIGLYAGEHVAGTEFIIAPLFVAHGISASDLFLGLLIGNLLAVLSWGFLTGPVATKTRLNLYWHLRKIVGPYVYLQYYECPDVCLSGRCHDFCGSHRGRPSTPHGYARLEGCLSQQRRLGVGGVCCGHSGHGVDHFGL